jgi:hypothetical protein
VQTTTQQGDQLSAAQRQISRERVKIRMKKEIENSEADLASLNEKGTIINNDLLVNQALINDLGGTGNIEEDKKKGTYTEEELK